MSRDHGSGVAPTSDEARAEHTTLLVGDEKQFFRESLNAAMERCGLRTSEQSEVYLTSLLNEQVRSAQTVERLEEPFAVRLAKAMQHSGAERFDKLRVLGDDVLFASGFFNEHLARRGLSNDYITGMGQLAYNGAASTLRGYSRERSVFDELASQFRNLVDLLRHVAESLVTTAALTEADFVKLYERWLRTGSEVLSAALFRVGMIPTQQRMLS